MQQEDVASAPPGDLKAVFCVLEAPRRRKAACAEIVLRQDPIPSMAETELVFADLGLGFGFVGHRVER